MIKEVTNNDLSEVQQEEVTLVDFYADWCSPCRALGKMFVELEKQIDVNIYKINVDTNRELAAKFQVTGIPCCLIFKKGKEVNRIVGVKPLDFFKEELKIK